MKGKIIDVKDYGTIVEITAEFVPHLDRETFPVPMDWRMFMNFLESVCGENAEMKDLLGLEIEYNRGVVTPVENVRHDTYEKVPFSPGFVDK